MELVRVDTQRAYELLWEKITTLELAPGAPVNEQKLAQELSMGTVPVREALRVLAHENLVRITPRHGLYVADVDVADLERISEIRLSLESLCARLAAQRATPDDLVVLEALRQEQADIARASADIARASADIARASADIARASADIADIDSASVRASAAVSPEDSRRLFELDHKFHQALAKAARNKYLAQTLDRLFGLSRRLWYLALPHMGYLPAAVEEHLELVDAIRAGDADGAAQIMYEHVAAFYAKVRETLSAQERKADIDPASADIDLASGD